MKTIQVTLFMGEDQEILGDFASYEEALETAEDALKEVVPGFKIVIGGHQKGSVSNLDLHAHQRLRAGGCSVMLQVMGIEEAVTAQIDQTLEGVEEEPVESLIEEAPTIELAPPPSSKYQLKKNSKPVVEPNFVESSSEESPKPKKKVAKNPPAINVGDYKFWGCDQQKVLSYVETNYGKVVDDGLDLRRLNGKWALFCGKDVIWTTGYEVVAGFALEMAKKHVVAFASLA